MIVTYVNPWRMGGPPRFATGYGSILAVPAAGIIGLLEKYFPTDEEATKEALAQEINQLCAERSKTACSVCPGNATLLVGALVVGVVGIAGGMALAGQQKRGKKG